MAREDPDACAACGSGELEQDPDVLDTWFSSWLWPFSTFGWPEETPDLEAFYPGHVLVTGPDILFFWVARMIMSGLEFMGEVPFREVYLNGIVRDKYNRKMSKSLGNGIDPLEVVDRFGADALRYTVLSSAAVGTDVLLDHEDLEVAFAPGRNFANKIWNAGRFTLMTVGEAPVKRMDEVEGDLELADRWILSRLQHATATVTAGLERYRLHEVAEALRTFFWGDLADWYLELAKARLWGEEGDAAREAARATLTHVLDRSLRLLHPYVPFVTSALWERLPWPAGEARPADLMMAPWPQEGPRDEEAEAQMAALQELVTEVRSLRKEYGVPEGESVAVDLRGGTDTVRSAVDAQGAALARLARVAEVRWDGGGGGVIGAHAVLSGGTELFLPLEGVIDLERERKRLRGEIEGLAKQLAGAEKRLENEQFVTRAPAEVVEREREKAGALREQEGKLRDKLRLLEGDA